MALEEMLGVKGYSIGGKTGTSEDGVNTNKYIASFVGVTPVSDPQLVILITLYNPTGEGGHQGGGVAAPVASQVLKEVLPALEVEQDKKEELELKQMVNVPEIRNITIKEGEKILKETGLSANINFSGELNKEEIIIKEQLPKPGLFVQEGTKVELYF